MFENRGMAPPPSTASVALRVDDDLDVLEADAPDGASDAADVVRELQARIRGMQRTTLDTRALPTHPALAELLPGGALAAGGVYAVDNSTTLALGLLQGPSAAGSWCAVVGVPDLGVEAAAGLGLDLERLVLVPHPGEQWLSVVSALVDVVSVVLVKPGGQRLSDAAASKLASRLRQREAVLVSLSSWPRTDARLTVTASTWAGIGAGFGHLTARQVTVSSESRSWAGRAKSRRLWLPGLDQRLEAVVARDDRAHDDAGEPSAPPRLRTVAG
ncbi:MAG TPA: hypothetical protein VGM84_23710 [Steroidobacteraceae bacterium]